MADGIDNLQSCPPWPESCDVAAIPLRPDPLYGFPEFAPMPNFPPIDLSGGSFIVDAEFPDDIFVVDPETGDKIIAI